MSEASPTWTIVIPSFNYGHFIAETLQSVFIQERKDIQVVLVDDASTDNTEVVVKPFLDRIEYLRNAENLGAGGAWQAGLARVRGKFVIKLDADDQLAPGALEALEQAFDSNGHIGIAISSSWLLDDASQRKELRAIAAADCILTADQFRHKLLGGFFFKMPSCALRTEMIQQQSPPVADLFQLHDWEFLLRATRGWKAALLADAGSIYRVHRASISSAAHAQDHLYTDMKKWLLLAAQPGDHQLSPGELKRLKGSFGELLLTGRFPAANLKSWASYLRNYGRAIRVSLDGGLGELMRMHLAVARKASKLLSPRSGVTRKV